MLVKKPTIGGIARKDFLINCTLAVRRFWGTGRYILLRCSVTALLSFMNSATVLDCFLELQVLCLEKNSFSILKIIFVQIGFLVKDHLLIISDNFNVIYHFPHIIPNKCCCATSMSLKHCILFS